MFGLYPAGSNWVRHYNATASARLLQQDLVNHARFTAGIFHQPFGAERGAVLAQRDSCLVLTNSIDSDQPELVVVPDVEMQNLLWSFNSGYANQWGSRELKVLTGCDNWDGVLKHAAAQFAKVCDDVQRAVDGTLVKPAPAETASVDARPDPVLSASFSNDDDVPWLPSDYLFDSPIPGGAPCDL
ncbi:hypothetical protein R69658_06551 [Paraburkholderia aspalathi]|uniref:Uncharacterized protein n=1 Tax=Paraburkholderia aspalathi TaxID=1324617 RepID=A0ABM8SW91_9BURK|nr:hypothetical protein [Paraburkholderia aspalathi]MBK3822916.1 hypothetical protein [Paraburkholderia aspalathi]MBK3834749.1 hypothetical protein [Paraburkholderia aspalathi]MBK3864475.1 hypothetical protein [Paraburkholderia aspalathi]CAE6837041.1 hypothetical protein R69658_06551 [Paraburkholderia aspalathi]